MSFKLFCAVIGTVLFIPKLTYADETQKEKPKFSFIDDGWKPIIGSERPFKGHGDEILFYKSPYHKHVVPALRAASYPITPKSSTTLNVREKTNNGKTEKSTTQFAFKPDNKVITYIPIGYNAFVKGRVKDKNRNSNKHQKKGNVFKVSEYPNQRINNNILEDLVPPTTTGPYSSIKNEGNSVKTRETSGLAIYGNYKVPSIDYNVQYWGRPAQNNFYHPQIPQITDKGKSGIDTSYPKYVIQYPNKNLQSGNTDFTKVLNKIKLEPVKEKYVFERPQQNYPKEVFKFDPQYNQRIINYLYQKNNPRPQNYLTNNKVPIVDPYFKANPYTGQPNLMYESEVTKSTDLPKFETYKVTENQWLLEEQTHSPLFKPRIPPKKEAGVPYFLPTPYKPDASPTISTHNNENVVSNIFTKLSNKIKASQPHSYNTFELGTHFSTPLESLIEHTTLHSDFNQITTHKPTYFSENEIISTTYRPPTEVTVFDTTTQRPTRNPQRTKVRRRRPTSRPPSSSVTSTIANIVDVIADQLENTSLIKGSEDNSKHILETQTAIDSTKEETTTMGLKFLNRKHQPTEPQKLVTVEPFYEDSTAFSLSSENDFSFASNKPYLHTYEDFVSSTSSTTRQPYFKDNIEKLVTSKEREPETKRNRFRLPQRVYNEITELKNKPFKNNSGSESLYDDEAESIEVTTILESNKIPVETISPTTPTWTTTEINVKAPKVKRPVKYNISGRPKFSVKEYRQKLSSTSSTISQSTTTEQNKIKENKYKVKSPNKYRRPYNRHPTENLKKNVDNFTNDVDKAKYSKARTRPTTEPSKVSRSPNRNNLFPTRKRLTSLRLKLNKTNTESIKRTSQEIVENSRTPVPTDQINEASNHQNHILEYKVKLENQIDRSLEEFMQENSNSHNVKTIDNHHHEEVLDDNNGIIGHEEDNLSEDLLKINPISKNIQSFLRTTTESPMLPLEAFFSNIKGFQKTK